MAASKKSSRQSEKKTKDNQRIQTDKASAGENGKSRRQQFEDAVKDYNERRANEQQQQLQSVEIIENNTDNKLEFAINNGRQTGNGLFDLGKKKSDSFTARYLQEKVEQACAERRIDIVSRSNLKDIARAAYILYVKQKTKAREQEEAADKEVIDLTPDLTKEISWKEVAESLSTSVKKDYSAKVITFDSMLLAQTREDQTNVGFQAESGTGKSYVPIEIAGYFPKNEVVIIAGASPTAFFHDRGEWDDEKQALIVDLENKILVFLDQPHFQLLEKLRPLLSHDQKELQYKITDKSQKHGLRTKNVIVRGYPSVIFCTTNSNPDEQEKTRMFQLSPEIDQGKLRETIELIALRKGDPQEYWKKVEQDPKRLWLKNRIKGIRQWGIQEVNISKDVATRFLDEHPNLIPRYQRDFPRILSLIKAHALLNCFNRERKTLEINGKEIPTILATDADINAGFALYKEIEKPNQLGLTPYLWDVYEDVIAPVLLVKNAGITREDIQRKYLQVRHKSLSPETLRKSILPQLEAAGLIELQPDPSDRRRTLVYPTIQSPISSDVGKDQENAEKTKKNTEQEPKTTENIDSQKYRGSNSGVNQQQTQEILTQFGSGKKEENEEGSWKNVRIQDAAVDNDRDHDVDLCRICGCVLWSEQELSDHMALIHSIFGR
jgi:hypothetical protein